VLAQELGVAPDLWARELLGHRGDHRRLVVGGGGSVIVYGEADSVSPC
jgi:hypothetical protein